MASSWSWKKAKRRRFVALSGNAGVTVEKRLFCHPNRLRLETPNLADAVLRHGGVLAFATANTECIKRQSILYGTP